MAPQLAQDLAHRYGGGEYLDTRQTAARANISASFLNKARITGDGPPFRRIGKAIRYFWPDVQKWLDGKIHDSTSQYAA